MERRCAGRGEWAVLNSVWKASHNWDCLELPAKGKTTHTREMRFRLCRERKVVREFTYWDFCGVAIQFGAFEPQEKFWLREYKQPPASVPVGGSRPICMLACQPISR